jgi:ABC-2 type transport system ATP-binding protein
MQQYGGLMPGIFIENLTRDYGNNRGIFDLSFTVAEGESFGYLGPNGAGKTTTIRHLMGFIKAKSGSCKIGDLDCWLDSAQIQKRLGYIPGEISFFDDMDGAEFLKFIVRYRGDAAANRKKELLDRFELDPKGKIKKMSKGMKQKIGIIAAFIHDPDILILDEPTSGLDPLMQSRFTDLVEEEKERGKTILMSSHMFEEVERTCKRVGIIKQGKLVAVDSVEALKASQKKKYTVTFADSKSAKGFMAEAFSSEEMSHDRVSVSITNDLQQFLLALAKYPVTNLTAEEQSLEEIFMHYYGDSDGNGGEAK